MMLGALFVKIKHGTTEGRQKKNPKNKTRNHNFLPGTSYFPFLSCEMTPFEKMVDSHKKKSKKKKNTRVIIYSLSNFQMVSQ